MSNTLNLEVRAQVDDAIRAMGRLNKSFDIMGKANQDAAGALGEFGISLTALNNPLTLVASGLKASMDEAIGWSNTIDDVQKITGETAQETSKLVTVLGDFGIEANTLKGAAKALKEQGLSPNLETLKKLAAQYQAIEDPAERVAWGTKTLGRAFFDLSEVLTKTPDEFEAVEQAARTSGKIIGQDMVDQMEAAQIKAKQLQDKLDGLKIAIGVPFVNTLSAAVDGGENWVKVMGAINLVIQKQTGIIDEDQAALRAAALAAGDFSAVYTEQFDPAVTDTTDAVDRQNERLIALNSSVTTTTPNIDAMSAATARWQGLAAQAEADAAMKQRIEDLTGAASDLQFGLGELTTATLYHQAAQGLDAEAAYALAESMGLIDPAAAAAKEILDGLRAELESGAITTGQYTGSVNLLNMAIGSLPDGKTITITYYEQYVKDLNDETNRGNDKVGGAVGDGYASGGMAYGPTSGHWELLHGDERVLSPEQTRAYNAGQTGGGGGETAAMLRQLPSLIARSVRDGMLLAAR